MTEVCRGYYDQSGNWKCPACEALLPEECYLLPPDEESEYASNHDLSSDQRLDDPRRREAKWLNRKLN